MDNAEQDLSREKDRRREDDGDETNRYNLENSTYSQENKMPTSSARTDHILRNCTTINNLPETEPLTKADKRESCGKDVTNKLSLGFHIAIEKSDYETVEKLSSRKHGKKDRSFQAKLPIEETIKQFSTTQLEIASQIEVDNAEPRSIKRLQRTTESTKSLRFQHHPQATPIKTTMQV